MIHYLTKRAMPRQAMILSEADYRRLHAALEREKHLGTMSRRRRNRIRDLLRDVNFYPPRLFPADIVTMNSDIELTGRNGLPWRIRLTYPRELSRKHRCVSVFSGLGINLLGRRTGDYIRSGRMRIDKIIYQPEYHNHYHL